MNEATILGWTPSQWQKATEYYNTCNSEPIHLDFVKAVEQLCKGLPSPQLGQFLLVAKFWQTRRLDKPGEIQLEIPSLYRAR